MPDLSILLPDANAPTGYTVPSTSEIIPKAASAIIDGTSAATAFYPVLEIVSDGGHVVAQSRGSAVAAGGSVEQSWFPGVAAEITSGAVRVLGARIQATSVQSVSNKYDTDLEYQSVLFDTDNMADLASNARILTVNTAGLYIVVCQTVYPYNNVGRRINNVLHNEYYSSGPFPSQAQASDSRVAIWSDQSGTTPHTTCSSTGIFSAAVGDFFASGTFQSSGGALDCNGTAAGGDGTNCFLSALMIGTV